MQLDHPDPGQSSPPSPKAQSRYRTPTAATRMQWSFWPLFVGRTCPASAQHCTLDSFPLNEAGGEFILHGSVSGIGAAIQTAGAPRLTITLNSQRFPIAASPPALAQGWLCHASTDLATGGSVWTEIPLPYQTNGANLQFTEPAPVGNKFYRLHKP
jgi:hypothetical protein